MDRCVVCGAYRQDAKALHNFPKNANRSETWQQNMGITPVQDANVMKHKTLCGLHFDATCYAHPQSVRLNRNAVPTLHPMRPPTEPKEAPMSLEVSIVSQPLASHPPSADPNIPIMAPSVSTFTHTPPPSPKPSTSVIFALPSRSTLTRLLHKVPFYPGINEQLFALLSQILCNRSPLDRICILMFDEMSIREHIQYDRRTDTIVGLEDHGARYRSDQYANHALVFQVVGVKNNWKQPLAYYFNRGPVSSLQLKRLLLEVLDACTHANMEVIALVCDMGTNNVKTLKEMGSSVADPYIKHNGRSIATMFDPPHLLKCLVQLFRTYPIRIPGVVTANDKAIEMTAQWKHFEQARAVDSMSPIGPLRTLIKITDAHMKPTMQQTMNVKIAAQILSQTVSKYMYTAVSLGALDKECLGTVHFIYEADRLFDSFNGTALVAPLGKETHCVVTKESAHWKYWEEAYKTVNEWEFLRKQKGKPPSQIGWLHTIRAFTSVCKHLIEDRGFDSVRPRNFNQDTLENLFGALRSGCGCNENPTAGQFVSSLKTQIINGLTRQGLQGTNCEEDEESVLSSLRSFLQIDEREGSNHETARGEININATVTVSHIVDEIGKAVSSGSVGIVAPSYVSGFIAKRILVNVHCAECSQVLTSDSTLPCNLYIYNKEYSLQQSRLSYPSENLVEFVGAAFALLENILPELMQNAVEIERRATKYINENLTSLWITCTLHANLIKDCIVRGVVRIGIPWYCTRACRGIKLQPKVSAAKRKLKKNKTSIN